MENRRWHQKCPGSFGNQVFSILALAAAPIFAQESSPPGTMLLPESALPAYEADIDHAKLIRNDAKGVLSLGQEVYQRVCHN